MLHIHRASRADRLADALAQMLEDPPADPFAPEVVAVHTRGIERWLSQHMSALLGAGPGRGDGICANVEFPTPHRLATDAAAAACGIEDPDLDPWRPERAVWPLLTVVEEALDEPWLQTLATYLGADDGDAPYKRSRRLSELAHVARLFDLYAMHRPAMIAAWLAGQDLDASGDPLSAKDAWQAELWRRLRALINSPSPAERRDEARERLRDDPALSGLPARFSLFGLTRLPAGQLQILRALAVHRDVHLFLLHPSPALWLEVSRADLQPSARRSPDLTAGFTDNRLLASWGRDAREMQLVLAGDSQQAPIESHQHDQPAPPLCSPEPETLLGRLQSDVRANRAAPGQPLADDIDRRIVLGDEDRSVEIHSCHGRTRQVEVVRDAILHELSACQTLEPRDIIVMCPNIETFAPLISAVFGAGERLADDGVITAADEPDAPAAVQDRRVDLRVRLADRALHQTNPVLGTVAALLELVDGRLTASQVLDLADRGPVRRRFEFDDDDLATIQEWVRDSGIRWGLDGPHRQPYSLQQVDDGTWRRGLERILLGVTMTEDERTFSRVLPLGDIDSREIDLAGRFAELIERLRTALDSLSHPQPLAAWATALAQAADTLTQTSERSRWQRAELGRVLDDLVSSSDGAEAADAVSLSPREITEHLRGRLQGRPTRANFRTGHLTVCTLEPMRSVPHRVVCLLGLDDDAFPRKAPRDGDNLLLGDPWIGERDPRSEDRQLLLDALMATTERLIVTYTGHDEHTNQPRPPAVPIGELLDTIDATARCDDGRAASQRVVVTHPLQPFDRRNFVSGELVPGRPWSFDGESLAGARALLGPRDDGGPFLSGPLPPRRDPVVELRGLTRFVQAPVKEFLGQRLGVWLSRPEDDVSDALSVQLDNLELWGVGDRLLEARLHGADRREACLAEIDRGLLPPFELGKRVVQAVMPSVDAIASQALAYMDADQARNPIAVHVALSDGRLVTGTVNAPHRGVLLNAIYSRLSFKHRLAAWVALVAATASHPELELRAVTLGRGRGDGVVATAEAAFAAPDPDARAALAIAELERLVALYDLGMREPLPLFCKTSGAYAKAARDGRDVVGAARWEWESGYTNNYGWIEREDAEPEHMRVYRGRVPLDQLLEIPPGPDEHGDGWATGEQTRMGRLARRLWDGLLAHEQVTER